MAALVVFNLQPAFIHATELERSKVDVPDPVVNFLEADVLAGEGVSDADPVLLPATAAVATDEAHLEVAGILDCREARWQPASRGLISRRRGVLAERFVGPFVVELLSELIEPHLLGLQIGRRRPGGLGFERLVHLFVSAVLVRRRPFDELRYDAEPNPPDRQRREPPECGRGKRDAAVGADAVGKARTPGRPPRNTGRARTISVDRSAWHSRRYRLRPSTSVSG